MRKVLFLDVDGVLNHHLTPEWQTTNTPFVLDKENVAQLKRVLEATGAEVILSSTWRLSEKGISAVREAIAPFEIKDATPIHWDKDRKWEIFEWIWTESENGGDSIEPQSLLKRNFEGVDFIWAVLDDDIDADMEFNGVRTEKGQLFRTNFNAMALTKEIADRVIVFLNSREVGKSIAE